MWTVYRHIVPNGKIYVGVTSYTTDKRWGKNGERYSTQLFGRAIKKYGWENIQHEILNVVDTQEEAEKLEQLYIDKYHSNNVDFGYNICSGGYVNRGFRFNHSEEAKRKIGDRFRGIPLTPEHRKKISISTRGKIVSKETIDKLREASLRMTQDTKDKISNSVKSLWESGKYDDRVGNFTPGHTPWNKGLTKSMDERLLNMGLKHKGYKHTNEAKKKMSESHRGRVAHNRKKIMCVETGITYNSIQEAQTINNINNISIVLDNPKRTAGKLHWRTYNE